MSGTKDRATLELLVTAWMADEGAPSRAPEALLDEVFARTSRVRPDRHWLALLREASMRSQSGVVVGIPARGLVLAVILAALVALTGALVLIGSQLLLPMPRPLAGDDWPMFRGDATRTGLGLHGPVGDPIVRWKFQAHGAITKNISIVGDSAYVVSDEGVLHALRLEDGAERWSLDVGSGASGPSVVGGVVYIVDGNGLLHAIGAATGSERWRSTTRLPVLVTSSGPAIGADAAYLGTGDGTLAAIETTTGHERWRTTLSPSGGAPAYADGLVFVGTARDGFFAVDSASGAIRWKVDTSSDVTGTPAVASGVAYIGAGSDAKTGHSWAIDVATGRVIWRIDEPFGAPTIA